ncbi:MAG: NTP transferase domain-containing protein [Parvularculaceae bacterium]|nr:NTP transferase domain-containing protein [Parvularculaceae bacterium]
MSRPIQPVILSGGAGTRLWPLSRAARPKQFLPLAGSRSLFQETLLRVKPGADAPFLPPMVIGAELHAGLMREQARDVRVALAGIICEPCPRNTAAAAAVAAACVAATNPPALALLLPADHHVDDPRAFRAAVAGAAPAAAQLIVAFGIRPDRPHTGFGYIERGVELAPAVYRVAAFREKPAPEVAERYLEGGLHYWNAGILLFDPKVMLDEISQFAPEIVGRAVSAFSKAMVSEDLTILDAREFEACPSDSIDYAVMEKTSRAAVAGPLDVGWSDIGSWAAIPAGAPADRAVAVDARNCTIMSDGPLVGVIGLNDLVVIASGDAVLVAPRDRSEDVKRIVDELKARRRKDLL